MNVIQRIRAYTRGRIIDLQMREASWELSKALERIRQRSMASFDEAQREKWISRHPLRDLFRH